MAVLVSESGASYDTLEELTGLARRTIQYHVAKFEDLGFIERVGSPVIVVFDSVDVLDLTEDIMDRIHSGETTFDRLTELQARAECEADSADEGGFDSNSDPPPTLRTTPRPTAVNRVFGRTLRNWGSNPRHSRRG